MKYPIGIQDFRELRSGGYVYVDKTEYIQRIIAGGKYFFLSRPRRFGKSLLLSTMKELYSGSRELFEGLWIENNWQWEDTNPVIWLKFSSFSYQAKGLGQAINEGLLLEAQRMGIALGEANYNSYLQELIIKASANGKVALRLRLPEPRPHHRAVPNRLPHHRRLRRALSGVPAPVPQPGSALFAPAVPAQCLPGHSVLQSEVHSAKGRCDALVQAGDYIYALEFKLDQSAEEALRQIKDRGYLSPFMDSPKEKIAVGISFSTEEKRVVEWRVEEMGEGGEEVQG